MIFRGALQPQPFCDPAQVEDASLGKFSDFTAVLFKKNAELLVLLDQQDWRLNSSHIFIFSVSAIDSELQLNEPNLH